MLQRLRSRRCGRVVNFAWAMLLIGMVSSAAAQTHTPTEDELNRKLSGVHHDRGSGHQARAVETVSSKARDGAQWVRNHLAKLYITPARLLIGLGALGVLISWGKNKRMVSWLVMAGVSWLMVGVGIAAIALHWDLLV